MKRLLAVFELTVPEQRVIVLTLLLIVACEAWKNRGPARELKRERMQDGALLATPTAATVDAEN